MFLAAGKYPSVQSKAKNAGKSRMIGKSGRFLRLKRSRQNQPTTKISKGVSETDEEIIGPQ